MDDLKDILLDDEEVLWSGQSAVKSIKSSSTKKKLKHLAWMLFAASVAAYLIYIGNYPNQTGFVQVLAGIIIVLIAIGLVIAAFAFFDKGSEAQSSSKQLYAVTDKRVIIVDIEKHWRQYLMGRSVVALHVKTTGDVKDLQIIYGNDGFMMMSALPDADLVERLLIENFALKREQK